MASRTSRARPPSSHAKQQRRDRVDSHADRQPPSIGEVLRAGYGDLQVTRADRAPQKRTSHIQLSELKERGGAAMGEKKGCVCGGGGHAQLRAPINRRVGFERAPGSHACIPRTHHPIVRRLRGWCGGGGGGAKGQSSPQHRIAHAQKCTPVFKEKLGSKLVASCVVRLRPVRLGRIASLRIRACVRACVRAPASWALSLLSLFFQVLTSMTLRSLRNWFHTPDVRGDMDSVRKSLAGLLPRLMFEGLNAKR